MGDRGVLERQRHRHRVVGVGLERDRAGGAVAEGGTQTERAAPEVRGLGGGDRHGRVPSPRRK